MLRSPVQPGGVHSPQDGLGCQPKLMAFNAPPEFSKRSMSERWSCIHNRSWNLVRSGLSFQVLCCSTQTSSHNTTWPMILHRLVVDSAVNLGIVLQQWGEVQTIVEINFLNHVGDFARFSNNRRSKYFFMVHYCGQNWRSMRQIGFF